MNTEEILAGLRTAPIDRPPRDLLEAALARQQEVTPGLVQALTQAADNPLKLLGDFDNNLYYWSAYLLAVFREPAAFKPLLKLFQMDEKAAEGLIYEVLDEHIPPLLACTFDGDLAALRGFITAPATDSYLRGEGVVALGTLQSWEIINTHVLVQELRTLAATFSANDDAVMDAWIGLCMDLNLRGLTPEMHRLIETFPDAIDIDSEEITEWLEGDTGAKPDYYLNIKPITNLVEFLEAVSTWRQLAEDSLHGEPLSSRFLPADPLDSDWTLPPLEKQDLRGQVVHEGGTFLAPQKIGRNDPCFCGSGKKYKNCCG